MAAWIAHRLAGVGIVLFLAVHILDTFLLRWGPDVYNRAIRIYQMPLFRGFEVLLLAGVLYHALNGLRIVLIDFWEGGTGAQKKLFYISIALFLVLFLPAAYIMLAPLI